MINFPAGKNLLGSLVLGLFAAISLLGTLSYSVHAQTHTETLKDRCSGDVIIVRNYGDPLDAPGNVLLSRNNDRDRDGWTDWVYIPVNGRRVRWYCHSRHLLKDLDPGTWRVTELGVEVECQDNGSGDPQCSIKDINAKFDSSAVKGWYPERSRCDKGSVMYARLGPDRRLQMLCYK